VQIPVRLVLLLRPTVAVGVLLAVGLGTMVFTATPFLLPEITEHYEIGLGAASMISVFQLGGFVVSTLGAGRWLQPRPHVFVGGLVVSALANLASAALPVFPLLVALRLISGLAIGLVAWFGWVQAFGDDRRMGDVAVAGPLIGVVAAPLVSAVINSGGAELAFLVLAGASLIPIAFGPGGDQRTLPPRQTRNRAVPAARILLICLGLFTLGGASVFQYAVVLGGGRPGLSSTQIAIAFSCNALVGIPAARWVSRHSIPSPWIAATAMCALVIATTSVDWIFVAAVIFWGFAFWAAVPAVFKILASRSQYPEERAGDAQALMAMGRAAGPFLGGILIDGPGTTVLGLVASALMLAAAIGVFTVRTVTPSRSEA
jgi:DHA1 family inner membrane transport protein